MCHTRPASWEQHKDDIESTAKAVYAYLLARCRYPVPFKKLSESRSQYTSLDAGTKGKIHQINKETQTRDPREFVADEGLVLYRWLPTLPGPPLPSWTLSLRGVATLAQSWARPQVFIMI